MHGTIEIGLAFILFLPTFCVVGYLYCLFPRTPRGATRLVADIGAVLAAAAFSILAMRWGFHAALGVGGAVWKQVAATLLAYFVFLAVIAIAWPIRALFLRRLRGVAPSRAHP
jgi:uncharacterized membrane protein YhaH (DUF805 family)